MQSQALEDLSERLLRAGVAHRYVRRYMRELHDHYEDALCAELAKLRDRPLAEQAAWARLGNEEELARSAMAQPALRSMAARFPGLLFGAAPVFIWVASLALLLFVLAVLDDTYSLAGLPTWRWILGWEYGLFLLCARMLPVILGALLLIMATRQRTGLHWPIVGTIAVVLLGGTIDVELKLGSTFEASKLSAGSTLLPMIFPFPAVLGKPDALALAGGLVRVAMMLGIAAMPYAIWRIWRSRATYGWMLQGAGTNEP